MGTVLVFIPPVTSLSPPPPLEAGCMVLARRSCRRRHRRVLSRLTFGGHCRKEGWWRAFVCKKRIGGCGCGVQSDDLFHGLFRGLTAIQLGKKPTAPCSVRHSLFLPILNVHALSVCLKFIVLIQCLLPNPISCLA